MDLNEISGAKIDRFSPWKEKYHFYGDHIHTSAYGAELNARSAAEGLYYSHNPQLKPLQAMMTGVELPAYGEGREPGKPMVFITGDSTVKNFDQDEDGMWGWGSQAGLIFDPAKITWDYKVKTPDHRIPEAKIVMRFFLVSILLAALTFVTLKIR